MLGATGVISLSSDRATWYDRWEPSTCDQQEAVGAEQAERFFLETV